MPDPIYGAAVGYDRFSGMFHGVGVPSQKSLIFGTPEGTQPLHVCRPCGIAAADFAARTCRRHVLIPPLTLSGFESLRQQK